MGFHYPENVEGVLEDISAETVNSCRRYDPDKDRVFAKAAVQEKFSRLFRYPGDVRGNRPVCGKIQTSRERNFNDLISRARESYIRLVETCFYSSFLIGARTKNGDFPVFALFS